MTDTETPAPTLYLIDASGFIFRAFHALPPLTDPSGTPVGAVLGFTNIMIKLLTDVKAKHIGVVFDAARRNFRNDIYADYKANRDETPPDLVPQFPLIREATRAFGFEPLECDGYEADDLIAAYTKAAKDAGWSVVIVSSDKDLMQLIGDGVSMLDPIKQKNIGIPEVIEKFGVPPERVVDIQALAGDTADNVPGVSGIGVKTAAELILQFGSLEALLEAAHTIKQPKRRETLMAQADMARISKRLVTLDAEAPLPAPLDSLGAGNPASPALTAFLAARGFKSVMTRLGQTPPPAAPSTPLPAKASATPLAPAFTGTPRYETITDMATLQSWITAAYDAGLIAVDTETTALTPAKASLVGISLCVTAGHSAYIPLGHVTPVRGLLDGPAPDTPVVQLNKDTVLQTLKPLLEDASILKIGHNIKYDAQIFLAAGIAISPIDDTMLMSYALDGSAHGHGMDALSELHLGIKPISYSDVTGKGAKQIGFADVPIAAATTYAAEDADITLRLHTLFKQRLPREGKSWVYETMDRPLSPIIAGMEMAGILVDTTVLQGLSHRFGSDMQALEAQIHALAGHPFNVASPKQMGEVLFGEMGLAGGKKTKTGDFSTSADVLEELAEQGHEIVEKVLSWRQVAKLKSTYTDALQEQINPRTGRVHTSFALAHTSTGRLASSDPNLQNIPIRTEEGRLIRTAFVAAPGHTLLSVDYSQIELRLVAAMANIPALRKAFADGLDIHALTASEVFGVPMAAMTSDIRRKAKAINFGIIYGISGWGLAKQLGCEPGEANQYIKQYFSRFPELATYMERAKTEARAKGYVDTLFGRKCVIDGIHDKNGARRSFAERQAINAPIQGTAADIMKMAMIAVDKALKASPLKARMLLQVHDELVFEVPDDEVAATSALVVQAMQNVADVGVPLVAEAGVGPNWSEAH